MHTYTYDILQVHCPLLIYPIYGHILSLWVSSKYIGVTFNDHLAWNGDIQNSVTSANRTQYFIRRNIRTKDQSIREVAYRTLVRPVLEYSSVGSPYTKTQIHKMEVVQRRTARWTLGRYSTYDSVTSKLREPGWRFSRRQAYKCLVYKIVLGPVAVPLPPSQQCRYYKYSFFPLANVQWNMLPPNIALLPDLESFRLAISSLTYFPVSILYKSIAGRYRPVRVADGPITARFRFIKNASWVQALFLPFILAFCLHRTFNLLTFHLYCFELSLHWHPVWAHRTPALNPREGSDAVSVIDVRPSDYREVGYQSWTLKWGN